MRQKSRRPAAPGGGRRPNSQEQAAASFTPSPLSLQAITNSQGIPGQRSAEHLRPLLDAATYHSCAAIFVPQGFGAFDANFLGDRPIIWVIGDDMERSMGPSGFHAPSVRAVLARCNG